MVVGRRQERKGDRLSHIFAGCYTMDAGDSVVVAPGHSAEDCRKAASLV